MRILDSKPMLHNNLSYMARSSLFMMVLLIIPFSWDLAVAQMGEWVQVSETGPQPRFAQMMAYDSLRQKTVLFGGTTNPTQLESYFGDTWEWDGVEWTQMATIGPDPRINAGMIYDTKRRKVVLFGGMNTETAYGDTWEWDGTQWTLVTEIGPGPHQSHAMAYNSAQGYTLFFGGTTSVFGAGNSSETWKWDGEIWSLLTSEGPSPRILSFMVYDTVRNRFVLYGGTLSHGLEEFGDTWEFDGAQWTLVSNEGPGKRVRFGFTYDTKREKTILFGGYSDVMIGEDLKLWGDTWEWDGKDWKEISPSGLEPRNPQMVYDSNRNRIVLFGGIISGALGSSNAVLAGDTWEIELTQASGIPFGLWSKY